MKRKTISLSSQQLADLTALAGRLKISRSELVRRIVDHIIVPEHDGAPINMAAVLAEKTRTPKNPAFKS
jgi:metal-responsive CopG/Arc/MetJ family transcriptional regulator